MRHAPACDDFVGACEVCAKEQLVSNYGLQHIYRRKLMATCV